jgi:AcrR family transcriptional regulator
MDISTSPAASLKEPWAVRMLPVVTTYSAQGGRLNRRGQETRRQILKVAVRCLATGSPDAVSANLIAKEAGVTWGTIQHQFGDSDGVWAAVLDYVSDDVAATLPTAPKREGSLARRVTAIVDAIWLGFDAPNARAVQNLRMSLPRNRKALAKEFPATADALQRFDEVWTTIFDELLDGLVSSKAKLRRVRNLLPGALRGIHTQSHLSSFTDAGEAKKGLTEALVAYLAS